MSSSFIIAVDFDGTLCYTGGRENAELIDFCKIW